MRILIAMIAAPVILAVAPSQDSPVTVATVADSSAIIEDLAWDGTNRRFIVSDVHGRRLRTVTLEGVVHDFGPPLPSGWGLLGLALDSARRVLWATAVTLPQADGWTPADSGRAAILRVDVRTGAVVKRYELPGAPSRAAPGDLAIAANHDVIIGDGMVGAVYVIGASDTLETLVRPGQMRSTQQPVVSRDGATILVPWYGRGIMRVARATGALDGLLAAPGRPLAGLDGLAWHGRDLVAVYNGASPNAILRLALDSAGSAVTRVDTLLRGGDLDDFNHVAVVDGSLYAIVNAGWSKYEEDGRRKPGAFPLPRIVRLLTR